MSLQPRRLWAVPRLSASSRPAIVDLQSALELDALWQAVRAVLQIELPHLAPSLPFDPVSGVPIAGLALSEHERSVLDYLHPMIEAGLRRIQATQMEEQRLRSYEALLARMPTATLAFNAKGELQYATPEGRKLSQRWTRGLRDTEGVAQLRLQLKQALDRAGPDVTAIELNHPSIKGLAARIERIWHKQSSRKQDSYVLEFSETAADAAPGTDAAQLSPEAWLTLQKLSSAERKVALLAAQGLSNDEIAQHRCRSPRTIEYQMNLIFRKLEINRRAQLVRLLS